MLAQLRNLETFYIIFTQKDTHGAVGSDFTTTELDFGDILTNFFTSLSEFCHNLVYILPQPCLDHFCCCTLCTLAPVLHMQKQKQNLLLLKCPQAWENLDQIATTKMVRGCGVPKHFCCC